MLSSAQVAQVKFVEVHKNLTITACGDCIFYIEAWFRGKAENQMARQDEAKIYVGNQPVEGLLRLKRIARIVVA